MKSILSKLILSLLVVPHVMAFSFEEFNAKLKKPLSSSTLTPTILNPWNKEEEIAKIKIFAKAKINQANKKFNNLKKDSLNLDQQQIAIIAAVSAIMIYIAYDIASKQVAKKSDFDTFNLQGINPFVKDSKREENNPFSVIFTDSKQTNSSGLSENNKDSKIVEITFASPTFDSTTGLDIKDFENFLTVAANDPRNSPNKPVTVLGFTIPEDLYNSK